MISKSIIDIEYRGNNFPINYFLRQGSGSETILYVHGAACAKEDFLGSLDEGSLNDYTIVGFDFPGCGDTPYVPDCRLKLDDLVVITEQFVQKLSLQHLIIVGHSMGGIVALLFILHNQEKVKGFVSVEGNLSSENCVFSRGNYTET